MRIIQLMMAAALWAAASAFAQTDAGMITQLNGEASITGGGANSSSQPVVQFLKIAAGDKINLTNGAQMKIVYFGNGRQETWKGGGQIEVGGLESKSSLKPEVSQLPPLVINQLAKTPPAGQQGKAGMVRMRSMGNPDAAKHLDNQYADLKRNAAAGDTTPEVYLLSGLVELRDFARAKTVLADLSGKAEYKPVVDHFTPVVNAGAK
jgi:hypothetical protein